jgi:hypothetical protein
MPDLLDTLKASLTAYLADNTIDLETKKGALESFQTEIDARIGELDEMIEEAEGDEEDEDEADEEEGKEEA